MSTTETWNLKESFQSSSEIGIYPETFYLNENILTGDKQCFSDLKEFTYKTKVKLFCLNIPRPY